MKVGGIPTDESYGGYLGQDGFCHVHDPNVTLVAPITGNFFDRFFIAFALIFLRNVYFAFFAFFEFSRIV